MKKILPILILFMFFAFPVLAKINVVTTLPDFADITKHIGGDFVSVKALIKGNQDPHYIEPKPSYASLMNKADLFISAGLSLEIGWVPVLLTQSRNAKIQRGKDGYLEPWQGIRLLEVIHGRVDRSGGGIHPEGNPHYWLSPVNGKIVAKNIAKRLMQIDPENDSHYQANLNQFLNKLSGKMVGWKKTAMSFSGKKIITHHKSFTYFADWSGLKVVDRVEDKPGLPPSPSHMVSLIKLIKAQKVPLVITENYYDPKPSEKLKKETGVSVIYLPTSVGGAKGVNSYFDLIDAVVNGIKDKL